MRTYLLLLLALAVTVARPADAPKIVATGHDNRIDVVWEPSDSPAVDGWNVWRADESSGPFKRLNARPQTYTVFSDFLGENDRTLFYRVTGVRAGRDVSDSAVVSAASRALSDDELLTSVKKPRFGTSGISGIRSAGWRARASRRATRSRSADRDLASWLS